MRFSNVLFIVLSDKKLLLVHSDISKQDAIIEPHSNSYCYIISYCRVGESL